MTNDEEHLRILYIVHYVAGGIGCLFACFPLMYIAAGLMTIIAPDSGYDGSYYESVSGVVGFMFVLIGLFCFLGFISLPICTILSGRYIEKRIKHTFSIVIAGIMCIFVPLGTVLGVFTIIVLSRDSVKALYAGQYVEHNNPT